MTTPNDRETPRGLPVTKHTGVNAANGTTKTVLVSALLEVAGHVRFGDGTDIATTVTEKDAVLGPNGESTEKAIWAGTKRRGVDRRTIHELRDQAGWDGAACYIPRLCGMCPVCWLLGFTGTTQEQDSEVKGINAKSRVLYATSVSIEDTSRCLNRHSRNQVDERSQTTAGSAGIHEEEVIVPGTHFPTYTAVLHTLDWEIGLVAHAFLENLNANRYTAASRGQGGIRLVERDGEPALVVDESPLGVFPVCAPKVAGWQTTFTEASALFFPQRQSPLSLEPLETLFRAQGFKTDLTNQRLSARAGATELVIEAGENQLTVHQGTDNLMKRYYGHAALGYLRQKQVEAQKKLTTLSSEDFRSEAKRFIQAIKPKGAAEPAGLTGGATASADDSGDE